MEEKEITFKTQEELDNYLDNLGKDEKWYETFFLDMKYYLWDKPTEWWYNFKHGIRNFWLFRKVIWNWRNWDSCYQTELFAFGLEKLSNAIKNGNEEDVSRNKKVAAINELVRELKRDLDDEIVFDKDNETIDEYSERRNKAYNERCDHIAELIKGQPHSVFNKQKTYYDVVYQGNYFVKFMNIIEELYETGEYKSIYTKITKYTAPSIKCFNKKQANQLKKLLTNYYGISEDDIEIRTDTYTGYTEIFDGTGIEGWWE